MLRPVARMTASYLGLVGWLIKDIIGTLKSRLWVYVLLTVAVIGTKIITFGGFLLLLNSYITDKPIEILPLDLSGLMPDPIMWVPLILLAGTSMGLLSYIEARWRVRLSSDYAIDAMGRAFRLFARPDFEMSGPRDVSHNFKVRLLVGDSFAMMRAAMQVIGAILPAIQLVVTTAILFALSWEMAIFILGLGLLYLIPFYFINRRILHTLALRPQVNGQFKADVETALQEIALPQYRFAVGDRTQDDLFEKPALRMRFNLFLKIRTIRDAVNLVSSIYLSIFMAILTIYLSRISAEAILIGFAVYAIVMFHAYSAANAIARQVAILNRFLPEFRRFVDLLSRPASASPAVGLLRPPKFRVGKDKALAGSLKEVALKQGQVCLIIQPVKLVARSQALWLENIGLKYGPRLRPYFAVAASDFPNITLSELIGEADSGEADVSIRPVLALPFMEEFLSGLPDGLNTRIEQIIEIPPHVGLALSVAAAVTMGANVIVIGGRTFSSAAENYRQEIRAAMPDMIWMIDLDGEGAPEAWPEEGECMVLASGNGVIGLGDREWGADAFSSNRARFSRKGAKPGDIILDDEDDDIL